MSEPLKAVVKPSRLALYYLLLAHGVALWALLMAGVYVALIGLVVSFFYYLRVWSTQSGLCLLQVQGDNCQFEYGQGVARQGRLGKRHFISDLLLVVQVRPLQGRRYRYLVIFRDALDVEAFRRLRVLLLFPETDESSSSLGLK
ncbi:MAG: protein YgfX [Pseudomonadales bacterium]